MWLFKKKPVFATRRRNFVLITLECMLCSKHNSNAIWFTFEINVFVYVDLLLFCFRLIQVSDAFVYQLMNEEMILVFSNDLQSIASIWLCVCVFFLYYGRVPSVWHFAQMLFGNVRLSFANKFDWYLSDVELRRKMCWRWNSQKIKDKHHFCFFFSLHFVYNSVCWFMDLI